jgi:hypothetical protein
MFYCPTIYVIVYMYMYIVCLYDTAISLTSGAETANPSGAPKFIPVLVGFALLDLWFYVYVL